MNFAAVRLSAGRTFEIAIDAFEYVAVDSQRPVQYPHQQGRFFSGRVGARMSSGACPMPSTCRPIANSRLKPSATILSSRLVGRQRKERGKARLITPGDVEVAIAGRRQCLAANVPRDRIGLPRRSDSRLRAVYAGRQLVELPAAQTRYAQG